jgi:hypothetical protein
MQYLSKSRLLKVQKLKNRTSRNIEHSIIERSHGLSFMMGGSIICQTTLNVVAELFSFCASRYLSIEKILV